MYTNRRTWVIKRGHIQEAIDLIASFDSDRTYRLYGSDGIAPVDFDTITAETDFETLAEYEMYWQKAFESSELAEFNEELEKITVPGGRNELLKRLI